MKYLVLVFVLVLTPAYAVDRALVVNEQEMNALVQLIDEALKAKGVAVAQNANYWLNKINTAPVVTEQKPESPKEPEK